MAESVMIDNVNKVHRVFVINPGSTSTKISMFRGAECEFSRTVRHVPEELVNFKKAVDQFGYRFALIEKLLAAESVRLDDVDAFAGRGGLLRPLKSGTYMVGKAMLDDLSGSRYGDHACNLGALLADGMAAPYGKPAYIVNPVVVDEMTDEARYTGLPGIKRKSIFHALNQKAVAMRAAADAGIDYHNCRLIVAHLGGGISVAVHNNGLVADVNNALEEGPFTPERAGSLPTGQLVDMCFSGRYSRAEIEKMLTGRGGLYAYTGTTDCRRLEIEAQTDDSVRRLLEAMVYGISKEICANAAVLFGKVDRIVITGGLAHSDFIVERIRERVSFLAPVVVYPGEDEMTALADGVNRVLDGREKALTYGEDTYD